MSELFWLGHPHPQGDYQTGNQGLRIVRVKWTDASHTEDYLSGRALQDFIDTDYHLVTVGFLIGLTEKAIVLSPEQSGEEGRWRRGMRIIREDVLEVEVLKDAEGEGALLPWVSALLEGPRVCIDGRDGGERGPDGGGGPR